MAPLCSATARPGRPSEAAQVLTEQLGALLSSVVDARQLCIDAGKAAWAVYVDIYVLDAGGLLTWCCRGCQKVVASCCCAPHLPAAAWPACLLLFCWFPLHAVLHSLLCLHTRRLLESLPCPPPWQGATLHAAQSGLVGAPVCALPAFAAGRARRGSPDTFIPQAFLASLWFAGCAPAHLLLHISKLPCTSLPALHADGSLHDACLLAALAALSSLRLRAVSIDESGRVQTGAAAQQQQQGEQLAGQQERQLALSCLPGSSTCGLYRGRLLADPTAEEEPLLEAQVTAVLDESGAVLGAAESAAGPVGCAVCWFVQRICLCSWAHLVGTVEQRLWTICCNCA